jgi:hypothetical protein
MAWRHHRIWIIAVLLISGLALAWLIAMTPIPESARIAPVATTTPDLTGQAIYTNGEYGFLIMYPESARIEETSVGLWGSMYPISPTWRVGGDPEGEGDPIISIITYELDRDHAYPLHYYAMVRVGASSDPRELQNCERVTPNRGETALPDETFGNATWKAFAFEDAGMHQYERGVSYRTRRGDACIAIEKIAAGSNYRELAPHPDDIPDAVLAEKYGALDPILHSFMFVR